MTNRLNEAIDKIINLSDKDKVNIKGKLYTTIDKRINIFRSLYGSDARITTKIIHNDLEKVVVEATIFVYENGNWREIGNDFGEEFRSHGMVNKTSALENCTTSAIGRALANCGLGCGEYASSFEVDNAIHNKKAVEYTLYDVEGKPIAVYENELEYLEGLRLHLADPDKEGSKEMYLKNIPLITKAKQSLSAQKHKEAKSFEKLVDLYTS